MASFVSLSSLNYFSPQFSTNLPNFSFNPIVVNQNELDINFSTFLAVNFNKTQAHSSSPVTSQKSVIKSQPLPTNLTSLPQNSSPTTEATSPSLLATSLAFLNRDKSSKNRSEPINKNLQEQDEYETTNWAKSHQILSDSDSFQDIDQLLNFGLIQPSQSVSEYSPPSLVDVIPLGTIILLGLVGASYGIVRQYSHHPQWHLELWKKFQALIGNPQETVPSKTVILHDQAMDNLKQIESHVSSLDSKQFDQRDFIHLSLLHIQVMKDIGDYQGFSENAKQFQTVMAVKKQQEDLSFIEINHQGSIHQKFYQYWSDLAKATTDISQIKPKLQEKLQDYLPEVKTEEGKEGLKKYVKLISQLLDFPYQPFSLNLYQSLQDTDSVEYQALNTITTLLSNLSDAEITNLKSLTCFVIAHRDIFNLVGKEINLPKKYQQPQIYAKILQYYAMSDRYQTSLIIFDQLLDTLKQWYDPYQVVKGIRLEYPSSDYQQPPSFQAKIPGLALYLKYKNRLRNEKTDSTYLDFEQERVVTCH